MNFIFIFIFIIPKCLPLYYYDSFSVLNYLNSPKENEKELKEIINYISDTLQDVYAYNEIAKNPPQPYFDKNYHKKVDIQKLLHEINTANISLYQLYQQLNTKIAELKDLHIDIKFGSKKGQILDSLYSIVPIKFVVKKINGEYNIFYKLNNYQYFFDKNILDMIEINNNQSILLINNQNPFDFIMNFCGIVGSTKNPHGTFTYKFNAHYGYNLRLYPLDYKDLKLEITFENGKKIHINYIFASTYEISNLTEIKSGNIISEDIKDPLFDEYVNNKNISIKSKKLNKLKKEFNELMNFEKSTSKIDENIINWDFYYNNPDKNIFKCRVDESNKVDVYFIHTFSPENDTLYKDTFFKCVDLFDKNQYPIIVILNHNDGGYASLPKLMLELISPFISTCKYTAKKINNFMISNKKLFEIEDIIEVDYGKNNKINLTKPYEDLIWLNEKIINHKKALINKRKPTDILIYTDGYSFSAASTFVKSFQYYGGGIVAGFLGNPKENNIPFDSGQSSSSIFNNETLYLSSPNAYRNLNDKYNISLSMPGNQNFFDDLNLSLPLEYLVTPIDERVEIYQQYKDNIYELFIENAKNIINKYKKKCNPKNKKLVFITNKCDGKFENKYTHGGYECGDNGFWSDKCIPSYCDDEYIFNHHLKKCFKINTKNNIIIYILILFIIFILYNLIILEKEEENEEKDDGSIELMDLSDKNK